MRKGLVALLTAGLLLLGVSPVWAAGQAMAAVPAQQDENARVVEPEGMYLNEAYLAETNGGQAQVLIRVLKLAYRAGKAAKELVEKNEFITGVIVGHYASKYILDPFDRTVGKAWRRAKETLGHAYHTASKAVKHAAGKAAKKVVEHTLTDPVLWPAVR